MDVHVTVRNLHVTLLVDLWPESPPTVTGVLLWLGGCLGKYCSSIFCEVDTGVVVAKPEALKFNSDY